MFNNIIMIHFGKAPNEDKVVIEVSEGDLLHLKNVMDVMPLPERRHFYGVKELIETDPDLNRYLKMGGRADAVM